MSPKQWLILVLVTGLTITAIALFAEYFKPLLLYARTLKGAGASVVFALLYIGVSLPIAWGFIVVNFAAGYMYGFGVGFAMNVFGGTLGALVALWVCKKMCLSFVRKKVGENAQFNAVIRVVEGKQGFKIIALTRLTPIPYGLQNGLFSVAKINPFMFTSATFVGLIPTQILNSYMGSTLHKVEDIFGGKGESPLQQYLLFGSQIIIGVLLMFFVWRHARAVLDEACDESDHQQQQQIQIELEQQRIQIEQEEFVGEDQQHYIGGEEEKQKQQLLLAVAADDADEQHSGKANGTGGSGSRHEQALYHKPSTLLSGGGQEADGTHTLKHRSASVEALLTLTRTDGAVSSLGSGGPLV